MLGPLESSRNVNDFGQHFTGSSVGIVGLGMGALISKLGHGLHYLQNPHIKRQHWQKDSRACSLWVWMSDSIP